MSDELDRYSFGARSYDWRLHVGEEAIENRLKEEVIRTGAKHAFVICSKSIATKTRSIERIKATLGNFYAGCYDGMEIDTPYRCTVEATEAARAAGADLLIAVGGGSVIVATRVIDIYLCEEGDHFEIMTQYPENKPAYSPRLMAPKLPIINIPTTPTSAMNRGGCGCSNPDLDQRMEYFDPKTRPVALIWDHEALMASPVELIRSTATQTFSAAIAGIGLVGLNPLVEGDREHIFRLAKRAYLQIVEEPDTIGPRIDLCTAALLANRAADDSLGGSDSHSGELFESEYAVASAMHVRYTHVWQGEAGSSLRATAIRRSPAPVLEGARRLATALDVWREGMTPDEAKFAIADALEAIYTKAGMPTRVRDLGIPKEDFAAIAKQTLKVFNANPGLRDEEKQFKASMELLEAAW